MPNVSTRARSDARRRWHRKSAIRSDQPGQRPRCSWRRSAPHTRRSGLPSLGLCRERAAAVTGEAAIGVDDDLAPGQPGVAHRAANDEAPRRVHQIACVGIEQVPQAASGLMIRSTTSWKICSCETSSVMLRGDDDRIDAHRRTILILHRHLALAVGRSQAIWPCVSQSARRCSASLRLRLWAK